MKRKIAAQICSLVVCFTVVFSPFTKAFAEDPGYYEEPFRNQFHFSPEANWMNDPNGMVFYKDEYHLFYQYHPFGTKWGPMHWGHAVSKDLVHWEHLPIALYPDKIGQIFSGSAVIDWNNTAGFGKEAMVAIFTHAGDRQLQSLAYSLDKGRTWKMYEGNPVMPNPPIPDWRDPKVFWHEESKQWVMTLAAKDRVMFYTSPNLKEWNYASEFGPDGGIQANSLDKISYAVSSQAGGSFSYEGDITFNTKDGRGCSGGLVFRSDKDAANAYVVSLDAENDVVTLNKNVNGSNQQIAATPLRLDTSTTYHLRVVTDGDRIQVFVNNKSVIEARDAQFAYGYYGLTAWNSTAAFRNVAFQNTSNFATNLSYWIPVSGSTWKDTLDGKSGTSEADAFVMSGQSGDDFVYKANIKLSEGGDETGSLVFRADLNARNGYMASIDAFNQTLKVLKLENGKRTVLAQSTVTLDTYQSYPLEVRTSGENMKVYLKGSLIQNVTDATYSSGQFGLHLSNSSVLFQDVQLSKNIVTRTNDIVNHDFETGDLTGWTPAKGDAFTNDHVSNATSYWGGPFGHQGNYHLWGFSDLHKGDDATGELRSSYFKLGGSGEINLLMGAGNDISNRYVSLVRASDDQELIRQANTKFSDEKYNKYVWDASKYIGEVLYIKAVDHAIGGWGHINLDDVHVYNEGAIPQQVDQVAKEPEKPVMKQSGIITDWSTVSGAWVPSTNGSNGGVWECPSLIQLPIDGDPAKTKWVLHISTNPGGPAGGSGGQYFVGSFDGKTFKNDNPSDKVLWTDYGADYYAAVDWSGIQGDYGQKYWLGWLSNWTYAERTPTSTWRSSTTLPRAMELTQTPDGLRLKQTPISLAGLREKNEEISYTNQTISGDSNLLSNLSGDTFEMIAEFDASNTKATEFGFEVRKGTDEYTTVGYDVYDEKLFVDRTNSGDYDYGTSILGKHEGLLKASNGTVSMHIFVDRSAVEVFGNNGETVITDQIFPDPSSKGLKVYSKGGDVKLTSLKIYPLKSIWKEKGSFHSNLKGWTTINGKWADTIDGKQGQSEGDAFILSDKSGKNFEYEADIKIPDTDSHPDDPGKDTVGNPVGAGALVFRSDITAKNAYAVNVDVRNNVVKFIKFVNGSGIELATYNNDGKLALQTNKDYHLKVVADGDSIKAYLDNILVIDTKDQTYQEGYFGLSVWDTTAFFNKVKAEGR